MSDAQHEPNQVRFRDTLPALEFCCWVVVALAPFLYWVNGPPVTTDQMVIQITLITTALVGAIVLRVVQIRLRRQQVTRSIKEARQPMEPK